MNNNKPEVNAVSKCVRCRHELNADERQRAACRRCEGRTREDLIELAKQYRLLVSAGDTALAPGARGGGNTTGRGSIPADQRAPVRISVVTLTGPGGVVDFLWSALAAWYDDLEFKLPERRKTTLADLVTRLVNNLPWAAENRADFGDLGRGVARLASDCEVALDPASVTPRVPIGLCPTLMDDDTECGAKLVVDPFADRIRCRECGTVWHKTEWLLLGSVLAGNG